MLIYLPVVINLSNIYVNGLLYSVKESGKWLGVLAPVHVSYSFDFSLITYFGIAPSSKWVLLLYFGHGPGLHGIE